MMSRASPSDLRLSVMVVSAGGRVGGQSDSDPGVSPAKAPSGRAERASKTHLAIHRAFSTGRLRALLTVSCFRTMRAQREARFSLILQRFGVFDGALLPRLRSRHTTSAAMTTPIRMGMPEKDMQLTSADRTGVYGESLPPRRRLVS